MVWNINAHNLPYIATHEKALAFYETAKPITKNSPWRALGRKSDTSKIMKLDDSGDIRFRYHHTDVVTYKADGDVEVDTYNSTNTVAFANRFLPAGVFASTHDGYMCVGDRNGSYYPKERSQLLFRRAATNHWEIDPATARETTKHVLDRSKAARIRKILAPFQDWMTSVRRVGGSLPARSWNRPSWVKEYLDSGSIPEDLYPQLATMHFANADMYVLGGAVTQQTAQLGDLPRVSPYDNSWAWQVV